MGYWQTLTPDELLGRVNARSSVRAWHIRSRGFWWPSHLPPASAMPCCSSHSDYENRQWGGGLGLGIRSCCGQNSVANATSLTCSYAEFHLVLPEGFSI